MEPRNPPQVPPLKKAGRQGLKKADVTGAGKPGAGAKAAEPATAPPGHFPIVGVGASAGGLEAFSQLLENLPLDTGMGFVLVQHMAPRTHSMLPEILAKITRMPVAEVQDGMRVEPNSHLRDPPGHHHEPGARRAAPDQSGRAPGGAPAH